MKKLTMALLYSSVGLFSMFFMVWLTAYVPLFQFFAKAEESSDQKVNVEAAVEAARIANINLGKAKASGADPATIDALQTAVEVKSLEAAKAKRLLETSQQSASDSAKDQELKRSPDSESSSAVPSTSDASSTPPVPDASSDKAPVEKSPDSGQNSQSSQQSTSAKDIAAAAVKSKPASKKSDEATENNQAGQESNPSQVTAKLPESNPSQVTAKLPESNPSPKEDSAPRELSSASDSAEVKDIPPPPTEVPPPSATTGQAQVEEEPAETQEGSSSGISSLLKNAHQLRQRITRLITVAKNPYSVDTQGRNPFKSFIDKKSEKQKEVVILTPAEKYALKNMRLVGIKWGAGLTPPTALFQAPDGKLFRLQRNDRIGDTRGIIYRIREDEVVIVQPSSGEVPNQDTIYTPIIVSITRHRAQNLVKASFEEQAANSASQSVGQ